MTTTPYVAMTTPDLVAERGRLVRSYFLPAVDHTVRERCVARLVVVDAVLTTRELYRVLNGAQQAARWVEAHAEHDPDQAAAYASRVAEAAEDALILAGELRASCGDFAPCVPSSPTDDAAGGIPVRTGTKEVAE